MKPTIADILDSRSASFWLRDALRAAINRDPVDAARDAELMAELLRERCDQILREPRGLKYDGRLGL